MTLDDIRKFRKRCQTAFKNGWYLAGEMLDFLDRLEHLEQLQEEKK